MRYDTPVYFIRESDGAYNVSTGNYEDSEVTAVQAWADITDTGIQMLTLVYGGLKQGSLTVRVQDRIGVDYDRVRIGEHEYQVDMIRNLRRGQTFVVSEVQT